MRHAALSAADAGAATARAPREAEGAVRVPVGIVGEQIPESDSPGTVNVASGALSATLLQDCRGHLKRAPHGHRGNIAARPRPAWVKR